MALSDHACHGRCVDDIRRAIINDKIAHAYIIEGDRLSGKTAFALDFVKAILCAAKPGEGCGICGVCRSIEHGNYEDLYRISADDKSLKDKEIESLQSNLLIKASATAGRNIAVIEDADTMTVRAQNRLLKTLEEPSPGTIIMLLSENSENLLPTIRSRCVRIRLTGQTITEPSGSEIGFAALASDLIELISREAPFHQWKELLESKVKDSKDALALLDALERLMRSAITESISDNNTLLNVEEASAAIRMIEEARKDISYNVNGKYAIKHLLLSIGG